MILLIVSIITFNLAAIIFTKNLTIKQTANIWSFTIAFQVIFDLIIEFKLGGYWYFDKGVDWLGILSHSILIPPVNTLFINWFPFQSGIIKKVTYIAAWTTMIVLYELAALLPEPLGFFHLGWWEVWFDLFVVPILLLILLGYFKKFIV